MAKKLLHKTSGRAPTSAAPKRTPTGRSGGTSGKLSVKKIPKTPVVTTKGKTVSMAGERAVTVPTKTGRKPVVRSKAVKVSGKYFTPAQAKVLKNITTKARRSATLPGLDAEQASVARTVLDVGKRAGATRKELLSAVETGLVESNFRNLNYGDADSLGWRQERTSQYGTGPATNVKGGAKRYFAESVSDTGGSRGAGQTAGQLAQTIQGSAFPERYDEVAPTAKPILKAYLKGGKKVNPKAVRKAKRLGVPKKEVDKVAKKAVTGGTRAPKARRVPNIVRVGRVAQRRFGLTVGEHPRFGGVDMDAHVENSNHYSGDAIDVTGDPAALLKFNSFMARRWGSELDEMFHDPGTNIADGQSTSAIGNHGSHVHVAIKSPGSPATGISPGLAAAAGGGGATPGTVTAYADATGQSATQVRKKLKSKKLTGQQILAKLKELGVGSESKSEDTGGASPDLAALERKYGSS